MKHPKQALFAISVLTLASAGALAQMSPSKPSQGETGRTVSPTPRATPSPSAQPSAGATSGASSTQPSFAALDTNRDGSVSQDEAGAAPGLARKFARLDKNRDGKLSASEFTGHASGSASSGPQSSSK